MKNIKKCNYNTMFLNINVFIDKKNTLTMYVNINKAASYNSYLIYIIYQKEITISVTHDRLSELRYSKKQRVIITKFDPEM